MTDTKISALTELAEAPAPEDMFALVDDSDTSMAASGTTKRITGANLLAGMPVINAAMPPYNADRSGATDARADIQDAIDDANAAGGGVVFLPWGTYSIDSSPGLQLKDKVSLRGAGMGATVLRQDVDLPDSALVAGDNAVIGTTGADYPTSISDNIAATATANPDVGDTTLTLDSTASLSANQYLMLGSDDRQWVGSNVRSGEFVHIKSVDSGTVVTLWQPVRGIYTVAEGAALYTITFIEGITISDLTVTNPTFDATSTRLIHLTGCRDFAVERVALENGDSSGVSVAFCTEGRIDMIGRNFNDNSGGGRFGYACLVSGLNEHIDININVRKARHAFTNGICSGLPGMNRSITISGIASEATTAAFDTHGSGEGLVFRNCHATNCEQTGYAIRSANTMIVGCTANHCGESVVGSGSGTLGLTDNLTVIGCVFRKALNYSGSDGSHVNMPDGSTRVRFIGCTFDGSWAHALQIKGDTCRIINCEIANPGQSGTDQRCIVVSGTATDTYIDGCTFVNYDTATQDTQSDGNANAQAISISSGATNTFVGRNNRFTGFTDLVTDAGTGTNAEQTTNPYSVSNVTTDRTFNANSYTMDELADVLGTLIADLQSREVIP